MTKMRLFCFGYQTPTQFVNNAKNGWDDENSAAIWIMAASDEAATEWGRLVAESFVSHLFERTDEDGYSWANENFVHWIETDPNILSHASEIPMITAGEMPNFSALSRSG